MYKDQRTKEQKLMEQIPVFLFTCNYHVISHIINHIMTTNL